jgi:hypothetical protein
MNAVMMTVDATTFSSTRQIHTKEKISNKHIKVALCPPQGNTRGTQVQIHSFFTLSLDGDSLDIFGHNKNYLLLDAN